MRTQITTPKGTAQYPKLRTPEYYEGAEVGYTIQMLFSQEDTDKLLSILDEELEAAKGLSEFKGKNGLTPEMAAEKTKMVILSLNSKPNPATQLKLGKPNNVLYLFLMQKAPQ